MSMRVGGRAPAMMCAYVGEKSGPIPSLAVPHSSLAHLTHAVLCLCQEYVKGENAGKGLSSKNLKKVSQMINKVRMIDDDADYFDGDNECENSITGGIVLLVVLRMAITV